MILIVSGEGPTDIGSCANGRGECLGADFRAGPMSLLIDKLVEFETNYSLLGAQAIEFISEKSLSELSKGLPRRPMIISMGKKSEDGTAYFVKNARALARRAKDRAENENCPIGAILFRDTDGTRSTETGLYDAKWNSILRGFEWESFKNGVPMIPKPKSEAWLLCGLQSQPYQNCAALEESLSGNDSNPNSAKRQINELLQNRDQSIADLTQLVADDVISATRIDMPSYNRFRQRLKEVVQNMVREGSSA